MDKKWLEKYRTRTNQPSVLPASYPLELGVEVSSSGSHLLVTVASAVSTVATTAATLALPWSSKSISSNGKTNTLWGGHQETANLNKSDQR